MKASPLFLLLGLMWITEAHAYIYGEGYSSARPGEASEIYFHAFTTQSIQEECQASPQPSEIRVTPSPIFMKTGDRLHRSSTEVESSKLVVEAYDEEGVFLPSLPIIIDLIDIENLTIARSDWSFAQAIKPGEAALYVAWACSTPSVPTISARVGIIISDDHNKQTTLNNHPAK